MAKHVYVIYGAPKTGKTRISRFIDADRITPSDVKPCCLRMKFPTVEKNTGKPIEHKRCLVVDNISGKDLVDGLSDIIPPIKKADLINNPYIRIFTDCPHSEFILIVNNDISDYYEELVNRSVSCAEEFCERALSLFGDALEVSLINFKAIEMEKEVK